MKELGLFFSLLVGISLSAQDVLSQYEGLVDPVTGDFNWSENVISISSNNGRSYPIRLSYNPNIRNNQAASWVGLGWSLNTGEISRSVVGFPDDGKGYVQTEKKICSGCSIPDEQTEGYGPMYWKSNPQSSISTSDVIFSSFDPYQPSVIYPALDQFQVSSSLLNGSMKLARYWSNGYTQDPQPPGATISNPNFNDPRINTVAIKNFEKKVSGNTETHKCVTTGPGKDENLTIFQLENDPLRNNYIAYFTKNKVATDPNLDDKGYLKYEANPDFTLLSNDAIVGFTVFTEDGTRLHYSLPVIEKSSINYTVKLDNNGNLLTQSDTVSLIEKTTPYAVAWKLTAVTGANYEDSNGNMLPDDGDKGYWLRFHYSQWMDVEERSPIFDFNNGVGPHYNVNNEVPRYPFTANVHIAVKEQFYLDKIETDRELLVFYKGIREDEFSNEPGNTGGLTKKIPALKLDKIVRYYKPGTSIDKVNPVAQVNGAFSHLNGSSTSYRNNTFMTEDFDPLENTANILEGVEFNFNYSLAGLYVANITNIGSWPSQFSSFSSSSIPVIYQEPSATGTNGKLTLLSVKQYNQGYADIFDPYVFGYTDGITFNNPNHKLKNYDYLGYYTPMSSHRRQLRYNTFVEDTTKAGTWALRNISYPNGTFLEVDYSFDRYEYQHKSYNRNKKIVPLLNFDRTSYTLFHSSGKGSITMDPEMSSPNDVVFLEQKLGRSVEFRASFKQVHKCYVSNNSSSDFTAYGTRRNLSSINLTISTDAQTGFINSITADLFAPQSVYDKCDEDPDFVGSDPEKVYAAYFEVTDNKNFTGSTRVNRLRVSETNGSASSYELKFGYSKGTATGNFNNVYLTPQGRVSFGSINNPVNSVPFNVLYDKVSIIKKGLDGSDMSKSILSFRVQDPLTAHEETKHTALTKCYVSSSYLDLSLATLWRMLHHEDFDEAYIPGLVECAVRSYVIDYWYPAATAPLKSAYDTGDWETVASYLPGIALQNLAGNSCCTNGEGTLRCTQSTAVECDNKIVRPVDPVNPERYKFYSDAHIPKDYTITKQVQVNNKLNILGKPLSVKTYDQDGNLILSTEYIYDIKAFNQSLYRCKFGESSVVAQPSTGVLSEFITNYYEYYYYPKRKVTLSKGLEYVEEIVLFDPNTGKPSVINYLDPTKGLQQEVKSYPGQSTGAWGGQAKALTMIARDHEPGVVPRQIIWRPATINSINTSPSDPFATTVTKFNPAQEVTEHPKGKNIIQPLDGVEQALYGLELYSYSNEPIGNFNKFNAHKTIPEYSLQSPDNYIRVSFDDVTSSYLYTPETEPAEFTGVPVRTVSQQQVSSNWHNVGESRITYMREDNRVLEAHNVTTNVYASNLYRLNSPWLMAQVENCRLGSFTASGFEDQQAGNPFFEGKLSGSSTRVEASAVELVTMPEAHTGKYVCRLESSSPEVGFRTDPLDAGGVLEPGRVYLASVWVNNTYSGNPGIEVVLNGSIDGGTTEYDQQWAKGVTDPENLVIGNWTLVELEFEVPENYTPNNPSGAGDVHNELSIKLKHGTGVAYFDDFRFHPVNVGMEVVIKDEVTGRTNYVLDANNRFTKNIYDAAGRVIEVKRESVHGIYTQQKTTFNH